MVLSIKAGGIGLNLIKASHVIIRKFICEGTIGEKIDQLLDMLIMRII